MNQLKQCVAACAVIILCSGTATAQEAPAIAAQSVHPLAFMFGEWVGDATITGRDGQPLRLRQTERVGPMLDGNVVVVEGKAYTDTGEGVFNALGVISCNGVRTECEIRSYTGGRAGTFPIQFTESGYVWSTPAGPNAQMRFTATFAGDSWNQIGEYVPATGPARQTFQMSLTRTGATDWPSAGAVARP